MNYKYNWTSLNFLIKIAKNDFFFAIFWGVGGWGMVVEREGMNST